jgi:hypothetical protein
VKAKRFTKIAPSAPGCALDFASKPDVRFGSEADISQCNRHVGFTPESDIGCVFAGVPRHRAIGHTDALGLYSDFWK